MPRVTRSQTPVERGTSTGPIGSLLTPSSIAIVGASPSSYVGRVLCENLRSLGYEGTVYPVNPRYEEILGWRCYDSLDELEERPDLIVTAVGFPLVPDLIRTAG